LIAVLGSGFGLYGHIPALVELGFPVATLARYRTVLEGRPELAALQSKLELVATEDELLSEAQVVVLARRPQDNIRHALSLKGKVSINAIVLEKPPAPSPEGALNILRDLENRRVFTPYLLRWCEWFPLLQLADAQQIAIEWSYVPRVATSHWKSESAAGGGILAFYFIHLVALVSHILPQFSIERFEVVDRKRAVELKLDAKSTKAVAVSFTAGARDNYFRIIVDGRVAVCAETPFGPTPRAGERDPRIDALKRFYAQEVFGTAAPSELTRIVALWGELKSRIGSRPATGEAPDLEI